MSKINLSPVIIRDFQIRPLALASQQLATQSSLKLQVATEDAKVEKPMVMSTESENVLWTAKGGAKVSSKTRQVRVSVSIEDDGVATELCNGTLSRLHLAKHAREYTKDLYGFTLNNATSSTVLLVTCTANIPPSRDTTISNQDSTPASTFGGSSSGRNTTPSYYSLPSLPDPTSSAQMSPECVKLEQRYERTREMPREARTRHLNAIGCDYLGLAEKVHDTVILDRAISILDEAIECSSVSDHRRGEYLTDFSSALRTRFERTGDLTALSRAIAASQDAVLITDEGDSDSGRTLTTYGISVMTRYKQFGDLEDLQLAITHFKKVIKLVSDPTKLISPLNNLASALMTRFERLGDVHNLEAAILHLQKAVELTPDGDSNKLSKLSNLGGALQMRFDRLGNLEDNEAAIRHMQLAVDLTPDGHPDKPSRLNNLGSTFQKRFNCLSNLEDIEAAIRYGQLAVELTPDGHPDKPSRLGNLGAAFQMRFDRLGNLEDIEAPIRHMQLAVELTPDGHPKKPSRLTNLGSTFQKRFERLGNVEDIEAAIRYGQLAIELTPDGHPDKPDILHSLADALDIRFLCLKTANGIDASLSHRRMAVKLTPEGHSRRSRRLAGLANTLRMRCEHLNDVNGFNEVIANHRMALELLPDGHPDKSRTLTNLSAALYTRYEMTKQQSDLQGAYECCFSVANLVSVPPATRLKEARQCALFSIELSISPLPAHQVAIDMLPRIAWLGIPIHNQHALLEKVGEVVRDAIGAAIEHGEYEMAVEWTEAGRSIAWQNILNLRSPLDELHSVHPELAERLQSISQQIDMVGRSSDRRDEQKQEHLKSMDLVAKSTIQLALERDKTVEEIREKLGFESFLKTKPFSQLAPAAIHGPIVILNVHPSRCDALILSRKEDENTNCTSIPLTNFTHALSLELFNKMKGVLEAANVRSRDSRKLKARSNPAVKTPFEEILRSLWFRVAQPVIQGLGYQPRSSDLPRIWWCATGPLALLPIHAAGLYEKKHQAPGHKLSDYVVSSYTPTISALLENSDLACEEIKILAVAQANAPGASSIPDTEAELDVIKSLVGNVPLTSLKSEEATIERVLEGMEGNGWVHLACHGQQNLEKPMKSGLLLHDGKLELERLIEKPFPNADFAFLSACQTATGDEKVAEESVHLAAGMLFSGYKGVVATMWSINDSIAPQIAEDVYRYMLGDGKARSEESSSRVALCREEIERGEQGRRS